VGSAVTTDKHKRSLRADLHAMVEADEKILICRKPEREQNGEMKILYLLCSE
jgi:hypothetical protein